ncbi:MAG: chromosome partitioning protein ParB, partial [Oscillospiraceae bacterium]|nr:chromosome partitioning protein ParB [Oscillospiraceae bacterium]
TLTNDFIAPPFSVLDSRQGYWQDRKRAWKALGLRSEVGRDDALLGQGLKELAEKTGTNLNGTSIFDPVLCEIIYRWFCTDGGSIYDCFAGGSVRGVVAGYLGYDYSGIELRPEQVEANRHNAEEIGVKAIWHCDDSLNADKYIADRSCDLVFSCPPYANLEQYSDDPRDISTMEYNDFLRTYTEIIRIALRKLKNDRFAVFVVGDIRDGDGFYRDFVSDTIRIFEQNGARLYNQIILIEQLATAPLRARRQFNGLRKVVKCHQNVLIFYNGTPKNIKNNYLEVEVPDTPQLSENNSTEL